MRKHIKRIKGDIEKHLWSRISKHRTLRKIVKWNNLKWYQIASISFILSTLLAFAGINDDREFIQVVLKSSVTHNLGVLTALFFMIIFPFLYFARRRHLKFLERRPLYLVLLALYFSIIIPVVDSLESNIFGLIQKEELIRVTQSVTIFMLAAFVVYLFYENFSLVVMKRSRIKSVDIKLMMAMYLVTGIVFSSIYFLIDLKTSYDAFNNVTIMNKITIESYIKYLYFSFITLSTIGFGDITPLSSISRVFVIIEAIFGVFLLSFSLGMVFSSGNHMKDEKRKIPSDSKECPFCAETIKKNAMICRHCGNLLTPENIERVVKIAAEKYSDSKEKNSDLSGIKCVDNSERNRELSIESISE